MRQKSGPTWQKARADVEWDVRAGDRFLKVQAPKIVLAIYRRVIASKTQRHTGGLLASLRAQGATVVSDHPGIFLLDRGGTVVPRVKRSLAIPVGGAFKSRARGGLRPIHVHGGGGLASVRGRRVTLRVLLRDRVRIRARKFLDIAEKQATAAVEEGFMNALESRR